MKPMNAIHNPKRTKIVVAPQSTRSSYSTAINIPSSVISVEIDENESVEWIWSIYPDGTRIVTGYNIVQKT